MNAVNQPSKTDSSQSGTVADPDSSVSPQLPGRGTPGSSVTENVSVDLDKFLKIDDLNSPDSSIAPPEMPEADRIAIVGIVVDDSGSMDHLRGAVIDGLNLSVEAFKGAKGSDFFLEIRGFKQIYFSGLLKNFDKKVFESMYMDYSSSPLYSTSIALLDELIVKAQQYRSLGIPTTLSVLVMTDGRPNEDPSSPSDFKAKIEHVNYIVGMGFAERGNEQAVSEYSEIFKSMGITKRVSPTAVPAEVRHAINQFSQSVASIATDS